MYRIIPVIACCLLFAGCNDVTEIYITPPTDQEKVAVEVVEEVVKEEALCPEDLVLYEVPETNMSFCYDILWGEPIIDTMDSAVKSRGGLMSIRFEKERFVDGSYSVPSLWFESADYLPPDGDTGLHPCFHCMYGIEDSERVKEFLYSEDEDVEIMTARIDDKQAWYVHETYTPEFGVIEPYTIDRVKYLIPYAAGEYHLSVNVHNKYGDILEEFVKHISF